MLASERKTTTTNDSLGYAKSMGSVGFTRQQGLGITLMRRDDIDPQKPLVKLLLINRSDWAHPNGTAISEGDRDGYRAVMRTGETRVFMSLMPGDIWLDVTDQAKADFFIPTFSSSANTIS